MQEKFVISPIGYIRLDEGNFILEIEKNYIPGLKELAEFSHITVLWWSHLTDSSDQRDILEVDQPYKNSPHKMGVFATRSPQRPNPIAVSIAPILNLDYTRGLILLSYIDALNGTPIIDIKPYHPSIDRARDAQVPGWCSHWPQCYEESVDFNWEAEFTITP